MKNYILTFLLLITHLFSQETLEIGMKVANFEFEDSDGNIFSLDSWTEDILQINYVDPDESELNEHFNEAVKYAIIKRVAKTLKNVKMNSEPSL